MLCIRTEDIFIPDLEEGVLSEGFEGGLREGPGVSAGDSADDVVVYGLGACTEREDDGVDKDERREEGGDVDCCP